MPRDQLSLSFVLHYRFASGAPRLNRAQRFSIATTAATGAPAASFIPPRSSRKAVYFGSAASRSGLGECLPTVPMRGSPPLRSIRFISGSYSHLRVLCSRTLRASPLMLVSSIPISFTLDGPHVHRISGRIAQHQGSKALLQRIRCRLKVCTQRLVENALKREQSAAALFEAGNNLKRAHLPQIGPTTIGYSTPVISSGVAICYDRCILLSYCR